MESTEQAAAKAMIKAVYDDQEMEINGRTYQFLKLTHKKRRKVFAFMSRVQAMLISNDLSFIDWPDFEPIERIINECITFEGELISKRPMHWEEFSGDYVMYVLTSMQVISYPFLAGSHTG